ncbi:MAG: trypsin-like peptidase domain-containing protein [Planctomycetota bacterium]|nr:trypsin-like peptidase domain-containing protein [Planctomycetota bacterium]
MRRFVSIAPALACLTLAGAAWVVVPKFAARVSAEQTSARLLLVRQAVEEDDILERLNRAVRQVAELVEPSVVHIDASSGADMWNPSSGSGWVYDAEGHLVTNAHVVGDAEQVGIQFADGRRARARVVATDPYTDVAVLKAIDVDDLTPMRRATNERVRKGDRVFAFGSPFGFKFSMTEGIISGLNREARPGRATAFSSYIQTDAAVNPGNSGGPLVDIRGRLVGMNVAIATARETRGTTNDGQSAGIGFAIPLLTIESVANQLIERGEVQRGFLGITLGGRPASIVQNGRFLGVGITVGNVSSDGPADRAGIRAGDVIVEIEGQPTENGEALRSLVSSKPPGSRVSTRLWRNDRFEEVEVQLARMPDNALESNLPLLDRLGMDVSTSTDGVVVTRVDRGRWAQRSGFSRGNVIVRVGETNITTVDEFWEALLEAGFFRGRETTVVVRERRDSAAPEKTLTLKAGE